MEYQDYLKVAEALAKEAGALCLEIQQNLGDVKYKSKKDVVTRADIAALGEGGLCLSCPECHYPICPFGK